MKLFRKVTTGRNPDIVIHRALTEARQRPRRRALRLARGLADATGRRRAGPARDAAAVPAHRQRRLGPRAGQRPRPLRRGRPARRRGRRRLRRRGPAARRWPPREVHDALAEQFPTETWGADELQALADGDARAGSTPPLAVVPAARRARRRACARPSTAVAALGAPASRRPPSACTATSTSARHCAPSRAGRSSTSRASPPSRSPSGCCPTWSGATSPGCCAPSTTPRTRWRPTCRPTSTSARQIAFRAAEWADRNQAAFLRGYVETSGRTSDGRALRRPRT